MSAAVAILPIPLELAVARFLTARLVSMAGVTVLNDAGKIGVFCPTSLIAWASIRILRDAGFSVRQEGLLLHVDLPGDDLIDIDRGASASPEGA